MVRLLVTINEPLDVCVGYHVFKRWPMDIYSMKRLDDTLRLNLPVEWTNERPLDVFGISCIQEMTYGYLHDEMFYLDDTRYDVPALDTPTQESRVSLIPAGIWVLLDINNTKSATRQYRSFFSSVDLFGPGTPFVSVCIFTFFLKKNSWNIGNRWHSARNSSSTCCGYFFKRKQWARHLAALSQIFHFFYRKICLLLFEPRHLKVEKMVWGGEPSLLTIDV